MSLDPFLKVYLDIKNSDDVDIGFQRFDVARDENTDVTSKERSPSEFRRRVSHGSVIMSANHVARRRRAPDRWSSLTFSILSNSYGYDVSLGSEIAIRKSNWRFACTGVIQSSSAQSFSWEIDIRRIWRRARSLLLLPSWTYDGSSETRRSLDDVVFLYSFLRKNTRHWEFAFYNETWRRRSWYADIPSEILYCKYSVG